MDNTSPEIDTASSDETLDLIWGIKALAKEIKRTERQTYDMCVSGHLPVRQVGQRWVGKRSRLESFFDETTSQSEEKAS